MSYTAAVITVSDLGSQGKRVDTSGPAVCAMLEGAGFSVVHTAIVPDEQEKIREALIDCADERHIGLIVTTGRHRAFPARCNAGGNAFRSRPRNPCNSRCDVG